MTTSKQFFAVVLLMFGVIILVHVVHSITLDVLPGRLASALSFVAAPLLLAIIVYWRGYFATLGYTTAEEYLFSPYYSVSLPDRLKIIGAIALLGFLPVLVTVLVLPEFERPWIDAFPFGIVAVSYIGTLIGYGAILFEPSRSFYRRALAPMVIVFSGLVAAYSSYASNPLGTEEWGVILVSYVGVFYGGVLLLRASRTFADKKTRVESEIAFAGEVQRQFLQSRHVEAGRMVAFATSQPARQLGGDFFHLSADGEGKLVAAVGDVSGHSFGAGLIMTMLKTSFENFLMFDVSAERMLEELNRQLLGQTRRSVFASLGCVEIDAHEGSGTLWNAGHMPPLRYCRETGRIEEVRAGGVALGLSSEATFTPEPFHLRRGDWLVVYSDGLVETRDREGDVRGIAYFADVVRQVIATCTEPAKAAREIMSRVSEAHKQPLLNDDATLIAIKFGS